MTLDELLAREAIRDTMAKYNVSGDRLKAEDFAACFTEDGILQSERAPGDFIFRYVGRAAILEWQNRWRNPEPGREQNHDTVQGARFVRHNLSTCKIDLTSPTTASARTYWVAWTDIGPDHSGVYLDNFQRIGEEWLISLRRVRRDWAAPNSLFVPASENAVR